jgi:phage regulator Rha-like protein
MNIIQSNVSTMSSREIAELTGKQHSKVNAVIVDLMNKGIAKSATPTQIENSQNGQFYEAYLLDKRDTLVLVARLSPEFTAAIIDRWQELESAVQQPAALPGNYIEALQALIESEQRKAAAQEQLAIAAPKLEYHDKVLASTNGLTTTEIASELNMSAIKLNRLLSDLKVQRKIGGRWVLTAAMLGQDLTTETTFIDDGGTSRHAMKWTEKGRKMIHELLN